MGAELSRGEATEQAAAAELRRLVNGYQVTAAVHVAAALGIADLLGDDTRSSDALAEATGTHPPTLYRLLRALGSVGVLREEDGRRFALTPLGAGLRSDATVPIGGWAAYVGRSPYWHAWGNLLHSVRTGENAFRDVHGTDVWEYRARHPEDGVVFDRAMTDLTRRVDHVVVEEYDFSRFGTVADVGGGQGALLAAVLAAHPEMQGILFDQPHVTATAADVLAAAGVSGRCRIVAGSFFDGVPDGADAYVLKSILHDWDDEEAAAVLRSCRRAMPADGVLLVIERDLGPANAAPEAKFMDLNMLVAPGGRERTLEEYEALFGAGGFRLVGCTPVGAGLNVFEGVPD